jgi:hypothetical protein
MERDGYERFEPALYKGTAIFLGALSVGSLTGVVETAMEGSYEYAFMDGVLSGVFARLALRCDCIAIEGHNGNGDNPPSNTG